MRRPRECERRPWRGRPSDNRSGREHGTAEYTGRHDTFRVAEAMRCGDWRVGPETVGSLLAAIADEPTVERFATDEITRTTWWTLLDQRVDQVAPVDVEMAIRWFVHAGVLP